MSFVHRPVLLQEAVDALRIQPEGIYVDGTAGGGGHSEAIAKRLKGGRLIAIDRDPDARAAASARLAPYPGAQVVAGNYADLRAILDSLGIDRVDGILLDLGVSSHQLDTPERGFSFHHDAPLDMRMSQEGPMAADLVATCGEKELADLFFRYGEEKFARRIAAAIVRRREDAPIQTTMQLAECIASAVPAAARREGHPARRCFQALRIAVNGELDGLERVLQDGPDCLKVGGVMAIITFHSLEDRMVKQRFAALCKGCTCPPEFPVCVCGKTPFGRLVTRKAVEAGGEELEQNPRSRSAKLRAVERIKESSK